MSEFQDHGLDWQKLQAANLKKGPEGILVYLNYTEEELATQLRTLLASQTAALFIFAHGAGGGLALGRVQNGAPNEFLRTKAVFGTELPPLSWKRLLIFHFHCYAGRFFADTVYQSAKAQKLLGLGISTDQPTQGHVMMAVAEDCRDYMAAAVVMLEDDALAALDQLQEMRQSLKNSKNENLAGQQGVIYGGTDKTIFPIGRQ